VPVTTNDGIRAQKFDIDRQTIGGESFLGGLYTATIGRRTTDGLLEVTRPVGGRSAEATAGAELRFPSRWPSSTRNRVRWAGPKVPLRTGRPVDTRAPLAESCDQPSSGSCNASSIGSSPAASSNVLPYVLSTPSAATSVRETSSRGISASSPSRSVSILIRPVPSSFVSGPGRTIVYVRSLSRRYSSASAFARRYSCSSSGPSSGRSAPIELEHHKPLDALSFGLVDEVDCAVAVDAPTPSPPEPAAKMIASIPSTACETSPVRSATTASAPRSVMSGACDSERTIPERRGRSRRGCGSRVGRPVRANRRQVRSYARNQSGS